MTQLADLKGALDRMVAGASTEADLVALRRAVQTGQIALVTGARAVAAGGDITDSIIVTGDGDIVSVFKGPDATIVQQAMHQVLDAIAADRYDRALQDYFRALRAYCAHYPYLTIEDLSGKKRKAPDEVYVPLCARDLSSGTRGPDRGKVTISDILRQTRNSTSLRHVLIRGEPGAGKSTLLHQIAQNAWDAPGAIGLDQPYIPMVVPLPSLALAEGASLESRLMNALNKASELILHEDPPSGFFSEWPRRMNARWLLLLDGFDEVPGNRRGGLLRWLRDMLAILSAEGHFAILTSRSTDDPTDEFRSEFSRWELLPLSLEQQSDLIHNWLEDRANAFQLTLRRMRSNSLYGTPLLLTIAVIVYDRDRNLPEHRVKLYDRFVDIWLAEAQQRGLEDELGEDLTDAVRYGLEFLALAMTECPEMNLVETLSRVAAGYLQQELDFGEARASASGRKFVEVLGRRSGVFTRRGDVCSWLHSTFREHLAACALSRHLQVCQNDYGMVLGDQVFSRLWTEVTMMLSEMHDHPTCLARWLAAQAISRKDEQVAWLAYNCLEKHGLAGDIEAGSVVASALTMALAQYRSDGGLDYDSGWESCRRTADALVKIGCPAVEALTHALRSPEEWARGWTAWALGAIGSPAATDALIFGLFDPDEWVREKVIEALGKIGDPRAVEPLTRILPFYYASFSSSYGPRDALANIGAPAVEYLITALCDRNHWVRWHATDALGMIGDTRAVDPLLSCLHDPDAIVRTRAAQALGTIGDVRALEPLIAALHDPEANVADATREAIGAIRQRTCEPGDETSRVHHDDPQ